MLRTILLQFYLNLQILFGFVCFTVYLFNLKYITVKCENIQSTFFNQMLFSFLGEKVIEKKNIVTLNTSTIKTLGLNLGSLVSIHVNDKHVSLSC